MNCNKRRRTQPAIYGVLASRACGTGSLFSPGHLGVGDRRLQMLRGAAAKPSITTEH